MRGGCGSDNHVGCSAGSTQLVITASGDVVACPFLYEFNAGNLRRDMLRTLWKTSPVLNRFRGLRQSDLKGKCLACKHIPDKCLGGCRAAAYLKNGDLYGEDPFCWAYADLIYYVSGNNPPLQILLRAWCLVPQQRSYVKGRITQLSAKSGSPAKQTGYFMPLSNIYIKSLYPFSSSLPRGIKRNDAELIQYLNPVGSGPSEKT